MNWEGSTFDYEATTGVRAPFTQDEQNKHRESQIRDAGELERVAGVLKEALLAKRSPRISAPVDGMVLSLTWDYVDGYSVEVQDSTSGLRLDCRIHDLRFVDPVADGEDRR